MPFIYTKGSKLVDLEAMNADELFDYIENIPCDSEDDQEIDEDVLDDSDVEDISPVAENRLHDILERIEPSPDIMEQSIAEEMSDQPASSSTLNSTKPRNLVWKKGQMRDVPSTFKGNTTLPEKLNELQTPYQFFTYFFNDELIDRIINESIKYSHSKNPDSNFTLSKIELLRYLGILTISSVVHVPNVRLYWNSVIGLDLIKNSMSQKRFEKIRSCLHFNDNSLNTGDKLIKLRPVIESLSKTFLSVPMEEMLAVDEQICATKTRHHLKQYLPLKPHKWGFKLFILSGTSGFCYKFEIYTGTDNDSNKRYCGEPDLGASANVVIRLSREIENNQNYKVYFDNYYTTIPLINYLAKRGIHSLGTARRNRIPSCKVPKDTDAKAIKRGEYEEFVTNFDGTDISNVYWKDNKIVVMLSSFIGSEPSQIVQRYDRKKKERVHIPCPAIVKQYNKHMGGVDLLDSYIGKSRIKMRSRKWYMRIFYHLLDVTIINSWLLYRRSNVGKPTITLVDFRLELAQTLCSIGSYQTPKRGRPSNNDVQKEIEIKKKKPNTSSLPPLDVRVDKESHFPKWNSTRIPCKLPGCHAQTYVVCKKCETALCFNKEKNCFSDFHT